MMDNNILTEIEYAQCEASELQSLSAIIEDSLYNGLTDKKDFQGTISILTRLIEKHKEHLDTIVEKSILGEAI